MRIFYIFTAWRFQRMFSLRLGKAVCLCVGERKPARLFRVGAPRRASGIDVFEKFGIDDKRYEQDKISCPGAEAGVANDLLLFQAPDGEECLVGKGNRIVARVNNCARWFFLIPSIVFYTVIFHFYGEP